MVASSDPVTQQTGEHVQTQADASAYRFNIGQPSPDLLADTMAMIQASGALVGEDADPFMLQYSPELGTETFRRRLAHFIEKHTGWPTTADEICITNGVSHGLNVVCTMLGAKHGDAIIVEAPTYFLAGSIFESLGIRVITAPMVDGRPDLPALARVIEGCGTRVFGYYAVPCHGNPTARSKSLEEKEQLVAFADAHNINIIADEVYELLSFDAGKRPVPPFRNLSRAENVISVSSFSKIAGPGLRLGWILCGPGQLAKIRNHGVLSSGGGFNPVVGAIISKCLAQDAATGRSLMDGLLVDGVRPKLKARCEALCRALDAHLPSASYDRPEGGYFVWVTLNDPGIDTARLLPSALEEFGVGFTPGSVCGGPPNALRLSFAFYSVEEMDEGIRRLAEAIRRAT